jgi:hypothetical protein
VVSEAGNGGIVGARSVCWVKIIANSFDRRVGAGTVEGSSASAADQAVVAAVAVERIVAGRADDCIIADAIGAARHFCLHFSRYLP